MERHMTKIDIATAPVSWGVIMKDTPDVPHYSRVLDEIKEAGYNGTELGPYGYLPFDIPKLRDELSQRQLKLISAFTIVNFIDPKRFPDVYQEAIITTKVLSALNADWIVLSDTLFAVEHRSKRAGRIRPEDSLDASGWDTFASNVNAFAKMAWEEFGLKSVVHPHVGGYLETPTEIDAILERTNPELVGLCFDMAHITYGGGDPITILNNWRDRAWYLHIKDCNHNIVQNVVKEEGDYFDGVAAGVFPELGTGTVDFIAIRNILDEMNYQGWGTIEQDILPNSNINPLHSAKRNRAYLSEKLGW